MPDEWTITNEFAAIAVSINTDGKDKRLCLRDLDTGATIMLDAIVLSTLARLPEDVLRAIMNPETTTG